ncbi:GAP family protein [Mycobacterium sp. 21AC1]|uniref:GAP family protein n=1 Tax=[Mycobacterium] appelbergii TaxID=2939269 RepID=UPI002938E00B|nr:GAP family protein [Mycobacterium sp. 21AC1]MDV3124750.1 GAP family protein [Mycobacterium sp. 21AC1]
MWVTVLVMAIAVIFEPIRIGLAVLMLNRPRPLLQLLAFLCGGFTMGMGVGLIVLFILRSTPLASGRFTVPSVQITVGVIALLIAAAMASAPSVHKLLRRRVPAAAEPAAMACEANSTPPRDTISIRTRRILQGDSLWIAWASGLGTALPSANFMGAMAVILASGEAPIAQAQALLLFNVVAFTLVEIPLVGYLAAPQRTQALLSSLHEWLQKRPRRDMALIVAAGGFLMLAIGIVQM